MTKDDILQVTTSIRQAIGDLREIEPHTVLECKTCISILGDQLTRLALCVEALAESRGPKKMSVAEYRGGFKCPECNHESFEGDTLTGCCQRYFAKEFERH